MQTPPDTLNPSETYFLLLKIESRASATAGAGDQVFFKAFGANESIPELDDEIVWTLTGLTGSDSQSLLDRLEIRGGSRAVWSLDELRVGGGYAAMAPVPEPGTLLLGLAAASYVLWRQRRHR